MTLKTRESFEYDVVIVGAGPAGLSAGIRLKQKNPKVSVAILEKGAEVGAHILSGAIFDPVGIDLLFPNWRSFGGHPFKTPVHSDEFILLGCHKKMRIPQILFPSWMQNHGHYIVSLGKVCQWLAVQAESLGVDIFSGVSASDLLFDSQGDCVVGVVSKDMGIRRDGSHTPEFSQGVELRARSLFLAEGARGALAQKVIKKYNLAQACDHQKYGLGLKEIWRVQSNRHKLGLVQHYFGWPLKGKAGGGGFLYHFEDNHVAVGLITHLDYENPSFSPFDEFQNFKTHKNIRDIFEGGKRLSYGARSISHGGWQSIPKLCFPGGVLIGCSAGFVNLARMKGIHNAILSGILAADHTVETFAEGRVDQELLSFEKSWRTGFIGQDLKRARNVKPLLSRFNGHFGLVLSGFDMWCNTLFKFSPFGTLSHGKPDWAALKPSKMCQKINYPQPDHILTFDRLSSLFLSGVHHAADQPLHLLIKDMDFQISSEYRIFGGPSALYCPAFVYEWLHEKDKVSLAIHAENCIHCKACDIKDPNQNIEWTPPQAGEGPLYSGM